ncbi:MAG TPA: 2'-deoxycytidine 5'-triphosphate deaminase [Rhizomicrobium sp.]
MSEVGGSKELFPFPDGASQAMPPDYSGVIAYQGLREMVRRGELVAASEIARDQFQPASLDLRLGRRAWRVRASFLPGADATVMERIAQLHDREDSPEIDLSEGAVFEKGIVYVVELLEHVKLTDSLTGVANPKSSTGRVDVLVRLIADRATAFDRIERKYEGPLYLEVAPQAFSIVVRQGVRLNQLRFQRGSLTGLPTTIPGGVQELYAKGQLVKSDGALLPLRGNLVPLTVDLKGDGSGAIVGYKARKTTNTINLEKICHYDPRDFWEKISDIDGRLYLDRGEFYILATREDVGVPPWLAAEMVPYDSASGEFRVHYAGFFDPGFGWNGRAQGSRAVLEVRSYGVSFLLEHGQTVGWLSYSRLCGGSSDLVYGADIASNYQGQTIALAKHFRPWPGV